MSKDHNLEEPATKQRARWPLILIFALMWFGVSFNSSMSGYMLPTTIERITPDPFVIGLILALNPLFGFIAQPLVGVLSDHIWTPLGRRAFFIIVCAPMIAVSLIFLPRVDVLWQLIILVVIFEFCHDMVIGSDHPLLADLIPPEQRLFVSGIILTAKEVGSMVMLFVGMNIILDRFGDNATYAFGAASVLLFIMLPAFFLNEKPVVKKDRPKLTPKRYISDFISRPMLRRLGLMNFLHALFDNLIKTFVVLFAIQSIGITRPEFGTQWMITHVIALALAIPTGIFIERKLPKHIALAIGFGFGMIACVLALRADSLDDIGMIAIFFGLNTMIKETTIKPFFTEYFPSDLIGQLSGAINIFYAAGRILAAVGGGFIVKQFGGDYRVLFYFAIVAGIFALIGCYRTKDERFALRQAERKAKASS